MKNTLLYSLVPAVIIFLSLFLPYQSHDTYSSGLFSSSQLTSEDIQITGINFVPAYFPGVVILIILGIIKLKENIATAIIGLVLAFGNMVYAGFLSIALTFSLNFFGGKRNQELVIIYCF